MSMRSYLAKWYFYRKWKHILHLWHCYFVRPILISKRKWFMCFLHLIRFQSTQLTLKGHHDALTTSQDVLAKYLIQFLLQMLFLYWIVQRGFFLSQQNNNFKSALKQRWSSTFIKVILAMIFSWKLKLTSWRVSTFTKQHSKNIDIICCTDFHWIVDQ